MFYRELDDIFPKKLCSITIGLSQRQWIVKSNTQLAKLLTQTLGGEDQWIRDLHLLKQIEARSKDPDFVCEWQRIKSDNKVKLSNEIIPLHKLLNQVTSPTDIMIDCNPAPLKNSRRHLLYVLLILRNYFAQKTREDGEKRYVLHVITGSKQVTSSNEKIIRLILWLQDFINNDTSPTNCIRVAYLPSISN